MFVSIFTQRQHIMAISKTECTQKGTNMDYEFILTKNRIEENALRNMK